MATITTATTLHNRLERNGSRFVMFRYVLSTGETMDYGPVFPLDGTDIDALRADIGQKTLDALAQAEIDAELG